MSKVLTDGKIEIGVFNLPDRKRPSLCIREGASVAVYGTFQSAEMADEFMERLGRLVRARFEPKGG